MEKSAEVLLFLLAITESVIANATPARLLPWCWPIAATVLTLVAWVKFSPVAKAWTATNRKGRWRWLGQVMGSGFLALAVSWSLVRFAFYGTVSLAPTPLRAYPGDALAIAGGNFAVANPKINLAVLTIGGRSFEVPIVDVSGGPDQRIKLLLPDAIASGEGELTVTGPLSVPMFENEATTHVTVTGPPAIKGIDRRLVSRGVQVIISGEGFDDRSEPGQSYRTTVFFDGTRAAAERIAACAPGPQCLTALVPSTVMPGDVPVTVETVAGKSGAATLHLLGAPTIATISPVVAFAHKDGFEDSVVTVTGTEYDPEAKPGEMQVRVTSGAAVTAVEPLPGSLSEKEFRFVLPNGSPGGIVTVATPGNPVARGAEAIAVPGPPSIDHASPLSAEPGKTVRIVGRNFDLAHLGNDRARFGAGSARAVAARSEGDGLQSVDFVVPNDATDGAIVVETPAGEARAAGFSVLPVITGFSPGDGPPGSTVTVFGHGLASPGLQVLFGGRTVAPKSVDPRPDGEDRVAFEVPSATGDLAQVGVVVGPGRSAASEDPFRITRFEEWRGDVVPRSVRVVKGPLDETLRVDCGALPDTLRIERTKPEPMVKDVTVQHCPAFIAVNEAADHAYVANSQSDSISSVDLATNAVDATLPSGGAQPVRIIIVGGATPYWINRGGGLFRASGKGGSEAVEVRGQPWKVFSDESGAAVALSVTGEGTYVTPLQGGWTSECVGRSTEVAKPGLDAAATPRRMYVAAFGSDAVTVVPFSCDPKPELIALDPGAKPIGMAKDPKRPALWVAESGLARIAIIDTNADRLTGGVQVQERPMFVDFHPQGCFAYVYSASDRSVTRILPGERIPDGEPLAKGVPGVPTDLIVSDDQLFVRFDGKALKTDASCRRMGRRSKPAAPP